MEKKKKITITLQEAIEWYRTGNLKLKEIALKAFNKEELELSVLPKTWIDHCVIHSKKNTEVYYIDSNAQIRSRYHSTNHFYSDINLCQTKEDAGAFLALMQLRSLWHDYAGNFKFNWKYNSYYCIILNSIYKFEVISKPLPRTFCFPTEELAEEFLTNFKDLFEIAKSLI